MLSTSPTCFSALAFFFPLLTIPKDIVVLEEWTKGTGN